jgi:hypothetical protein
MSAGALSLFEPMGGLDAVELTAEGWT